MAEFATQPMTDGSLFLTPGTYVRHPEQPDWGLGQVQSVVGDRVTVNFEEMGKLVINSTNVTLEIVAEA